MNLTADKKKIIRLLDKTNSLSKKEIAQLLKLANITVENHIATLLENDYLIYNQDNNTYSLTKKGSYIANMTISMRLVAKDILLIRWLNKIKRATLDQITMYLGVSSQNVYRRLKRLIDNEYIIHQQVFKKAVYYPTPKGTALAGDLIPPSKISFVDFDHDLIVVDLALYFEKKYGYWKSEKELRSERGIIKGFGNTEEHFPDGVVKICDKYIGIEVELSRKSKARIQNIYTKHLYAREYQEVWYLVEDEGIKKHLEKHMDKRVKEKVKVFYISEVENL